MPRQGQQHHNAKLSDEDVFDMRQKRESKPWLWSYRSLAEHVGCGYSTARDIVTYRTRRNAARADLDVAITTYAALAKEIAA